MASGPNIQLELRLAEMARMNEEIRRRHQEVEADKRRAQRDGGMVTAAQPGYPNQTPFYNLLGAATHFLYQGSFL